MEKVKQLYETTELTIQQIAYACGLSYKVVYTFIRKNYTKESRNTRKSVCYRNSKLGDNNPSYGKRGEESLKYKGDISDGKGYIIVIKPSWYTGRAGSKHVFKHVVVMCEALGITELPAGFVVHHVDENKTNNNINNLAMMTMAAHTRLHQAAKR